MAYAGLDQGQRRAAAGRLRALARARASRTPCWPNGRCPNRNWPGVGGAARPAPAKGWRWVAEMEEIAATMAAAGLPDGFHQAAAEIFRRSPRDSQAADGELDRVLTALFGG